MTIPNLLFTFNMDPGNTGHQIQSGIMSGIIRQVLEQMSGVNPLSSRFVGKIKEHRGYGITGMVQVRLPNTGVELTDRVIGSQVGLAAVHPGFKAALDAALLSATSISSALVDIASSLDHAISQQPPGLIVTSAPPEPPAVGLALELNPAFFGGYNFKLTGDLAIDAEATVSIQTNYTSGEWRQMNISAPNSNSLGTPMFGAWKSNLLATVDGSTYDSLADIRVSPVEARILKDAIDVGTAGGLPNGIPSVMVMGHYFSGGYYNVFTHVLGSAGSAKIINLIETGHAGVGINGNFASDIVWKNTTGAIQLAGTNLGLMQIYGLDFMIV